MSTVKKAAVMLFLSACLIIAFSIFTCAYANTLPGTNSPEFISPIKQTNCKTEETVSPTFTLPASLTTIEEGAFEGTAITTVTLPEKVTTIGEYAFANIRTLRIIHIPEATTKIGKNAFKGSANVIITGPPTGYARAWAHENGMPFNPIATFYLSNNTTLSNGIINNNTEIDNLSGTAENVQVKEQKPTGRFSGDLSVDRCETIIAFHIQGRSPPMG